MTTKAYASKPCIPAHRSRAGGRGHGRCTACGDVAVNAMQMQPDSVHLTGANLLHEVPMECMCDVHDTT